MSRTIYVDELQHFGVKGMKWGVRKASGSQSSARKNAEGSVSDEERKAQRRATAKKIAIGVAAVAAVAGVSYVAVKHYNKKQMDSGRRAAATIFSKNHGGHSIKDATIQSGPRRGKWVAIQGPAGTYNNAFMRSRDAKLRSHSGRQTRYEAAINRANKASDKHLKLQAEVAGKRIDAGTIGYAQHLKDTQRIWQQEAERIARDGGPTHIKKRKKVRRLN